MVNLRMLYERWVEAMQDQTELGASATGRWDNGLPSICSITYVLSPQDQLVIRAPAVYSRKARSLVMLITYFLRAMHEIRTHFAVKGTNVAPPLAFKRTPGRLQDLSNTCDKHRI